MVFTFHTCGQLTLYSRLLIRHKGACLSVKRLPRSLHLSFLEYASPRSVSSLLSPPSAFGALERPSIWLLTKYFRCRGGERREETAFWHIGKHPCSFLPWAWLSPSPWFPLLTPACISSQAPYLSCQESPTPTWWIVPHEAVCSQYLLQHF